MKMGHSKNCTNCSDSAKWKCSICNTRYCSEMCQLDHWPIHMRHCRSPPPLLRDVEATVSVELLNSSKVYQPLRKPRKLINENLPSDAMTEIEFEDVFDPGNFYFNIKWRKPALAELMKSLNQNVRTDQILTETDTFLAVKHDSFWYRAELIERTDSLLTVDLVDYGKTIKVSEVDAKPLCQDKYYSLPKQALRGSLYGIGPLKGQSTFSRAAIKLFQREVESEQCFATRMGFTRDGSILVRLITNAGDEIMQSLLNEGLVSEVTYQSGVNKFEYEPPFASSSRPSQVLNGDNKGKGLNIKQPIDSKSEVDSKVESSSNSKHKSDSLLNPTLDAIEKSKPEFMGKRQPIPILNPVQLKTIPKKDIKKVSIKENEDNLKISKSECINLELKAETDSTFQLGSESSDIVSAKTDAQVVSSTKVEEVKSDTVYDVMKKPELSITERKMSPSAVSDPLPSTVITKSLLYRSSVMEEIKPDSTVGFRVNGKVSDPTSFTALCCLSKTLVILIMRGWGHSNGSTICTSYKAGDPVIVKVEDNFHRAIVLKDGVSFLLLDGCSIEQVSSNLVYVPGTDFYQYRSAGVKFYCNNYELGVEARTKIRDKLNSDLLFRVTPRRIIEGGVILADVFDKDGEKLEEYIVVPFPYFEPRSFEVLDLPVLTSENLKTDFKNGCRVSFVKFGQFYNTVMVQKLDDSLMYVDIFLQIADREDFSLKIAPFKNQLVACKWSQDNAFYRAIVQSVDLERSTATVFYVDYGNIEVEGFKNLSYLPAPLAELPAYTRVFELSGVPSVSVSDPSKILPKIQDKNWNMKLLENKKVIMYGNDGESFNEIVALHCSSSIDADNNNHLSPTKAPAEADILAFLEA